MAPGSDPFDPGNWPVWYAIPVGLRSRPERMLINAVVAMPLSPQVKQGFAETQSKGHPQRLRCFRKGNNQVTPNGSAVFA